MSDASISNTGIASTAPSSAGGYRRRRIAGTMAALFGGFGVLFGLVGAGTFLPYADMMGESYRGLAGVMTAISAAGLGVSLLGVVAGLALRNGRPWGQQGVLAVALALIALVAVMGALYPVGLFLLVFVVPLWGTVAFLAWSSAATATPATPARPTA